MAPCRRYFCGPNAKKTAALAKQITKRRKNTAAQQSDASGEVSSFLCMLPYSMLWLTVCRIDISGCRLVTSKVHGLWYVRCILTALLTFSSCLLALRLLIRVPWWVFAADEGSEDEDDAPKKGKAKPKAKGKSKAATTEVTRSAAKAGGAGNKKGAHLISKKGSKQAAAPAKGKKRKSKVQGTICPAGPFILETYCLLAVTKWAQAAVE